MEKDKLQSEKTNKNIHLGLPSNFNVYLPDLNEVSSNLIFDFNIDASQCNAHQTEVLNYMVNSAPPAAINAVGAAQQRDLQMFLFKIHRLMIKYQSVITTNNANRLLDHIFSNGTIVHDSIGNIYDFITGGALVHAPRRTIQNPDASSIINLVRSLVNPDENIAKEAYCACMIRFGDYIKNCDFGVILPPPSPQQPLPPQGDIFHLLQNKITLKKFPLFLGMFGGNEGDEVTVPLCGTLITNTSTLIYKNWDRICHGINHNMVRTNWWAKYPKQYPKTLLEDIIGIGESMKGQYNAIRGRNSVLSGEGNILMSSSSQYSTKFDSTTARFTPTFDISTAISDALKIQI